MIHEIFLLCSRLCGAVVLLNYLTQERIKENISRVGLHLSFLGLEVVVWTQLYNILSIHIGTGMNLHCAT